MTKASEKKAAKAPRQGGAKAAKVAAKKTAPTKAPKAAAKPAARTEAKRAPLKPVGATKPPVKPAGATPAAAKTPTGTYFYANGKRKTSVASVRLYSNGKGTITINERTFENYFPVFTDQDKVTSPLRLANEQKSFDITAHVHGGGIHSQAEAVRHGIAKALLEVNSALRSTLKPAGMLTRDSRVKERKKYGLHRARRAPQFSKR